MVRQTDSVESTSPMTEQNAAARSPHVAFVLGGGGRWGAVEVGMLRALVNGGILPDLIVGTSIGAFNGAVFAADPTSCGIETLDLLWAEVATSDLLGANVIDRVRSAARLRVAIQDPQPLRDMLEHTLSARTFDELAVEFQCVGASIERAAEHWFSEGSLIDALLASSAVPMLFPPVEIDGEHFYDGGLVNSVPVDRAVELGATEIYVLQVGRLEQPLRAPTKFYEPALLAFEIARRHRFGSIRDRIPPGVKVHILPSANDVEFDDRRQLKWSDLGETGTLVEDAYNASTMYLEELSTQS
jgi:NTE family protein